MFLKKKTKFFAIVYKYKYISIAISIVQNSRPGTRAASNNFFAIHEYASGLLINQLL